jgi:hypothetical protein
VTSTVPDPAAVASPSLHDDLPAVAPGRPTPAVLAVAAAAGLAAGALTSFGQTLLGGTAFGGLVNAVGPWLVAPFLVGALARRGWVAALAGLLACVGEVAGYYATAQLRGFPVGAAGITLWAVAGLLGGPVFGWAGRLQRVATGRLRGLGAGLLVGCFLAEALVTYLVVLRHVGDAALFAAVAAVLAVVLGRAGRQTRAVLAWSAAAALAGAAGFAALHLVVGGGIAVDL